MVLIINYYLKVINLNGKRNGKGKEYNIFSGNLVYEGEYLNGKRNGKGKDIILIINYNMKVNI